MAGGPLLCGGQARSDRECLLIETVAVRPLVGVNQPKAPWRGIHNNPHPRRLLGGVAFCLLSLGACVLVARHLSDASWPLEGAHVHLVFLAGCSYLAGFGFRAFGWHQLFPSRERPDGARCLAACGAAAASGVVLPFRLDYLVKISTLHRLGGVPLRLETIAVSIIAGGMVDAVAMLPLAISALALSGPVLRAPLIVVVLFCIGCLAILTLGQRVARLPLVSRSDRLHERRLRRGRERARPPVRKGRRVHARRRGRVHAAPTDRRTLRAGWPAGLGDARPYVGRRGLQRADDHRQEAVADERQPGADEDHQ
jgi:hypothetical protein